MISLICGARVFLFFSGLFWATITAVLMLRDGLVLIKNRKTKGDVVLILIKACQIKTLLLCMLCGALLFSLCVIVVSSACPYFLLLWNIISVWVIIDAWLVIITMGIFVAGTILKKEYCL